jgi:hypothetical protein
MFFISGLLLIKKTPRYNGAGFFFLTLIGKTPDRNDLDSHFDAGSLGALGARGDLELHAVAFLEATEALRINCREVNEHIFPTVLRRDETETLGIVEPLDRTETHCVNL